MNDPKTQSTGGAGGASALEARIERIRQSMAAQQTRLTRGSMLTACIGAILCVAMAIWFSIGYGMLKDMTTPKKIVEAAEAVVLESLPEYRKELEVYINDHADDWAAAVSKQVQDNIPKVREHMEDFIVQKADEALDQMHVMTTEQFRTFVTQNRSTLSDGFRSLKKDDEAELFVQNLHSAIEKEMSGDMREQSEEMLHMVFDLNAKLEKLKTGQKLNSEQALEREILMIARRLQFESQADLADRPKKKSKSTVIQDETEPEAEVPVAQAADEADKGKEEPKAGDTESKAKESEGSGEKANDGDKPAKDNTEKKDKEEKPTENEKKSGDS